MIQLAIKASVHAVGIFRISINLLLITAISLILVSITGKLRLSTLLCAFLFLGYATVDYYVFRFRGREITPFDILSIRTAANVAAEFDFMPGASLVSAWIMFIQLLAIERIFPFNNRSLGIKKRLMVIMMASVCMIGAIWGSRYCKAKHFGLAGAGINGSFLNFVLQLEGLKNDPPEDYSKERVAEIENRLKNETYLVSEQKHEPDVIVIMDESFADLSILGSELHTNQKPTPFIDSLKENTVRGYALSSVYGGDTANSEFEFLTGNSMFFLPENSVPYQQYINKDLYSLAWSLRQAGYQTLAMHPFESSGWMRTFVYPLLGFEKSMFLDDFPRQKMVRNYVSDMEMFEELEKLHKEMTKDNQPAFLFGVTMQNHGGYDYVGDEYQKSISLEGYHLSYPEAEQYLSLIHETDKAVQQMIEYFDNVDREVVIVFFGDHLPGLSRSLYEEIHGGPFDTFDEEMLMYKVPFFIWANYDIEEKENVCTSINYLSAILYDTCGMEIPAYHRFLLEVSKSIPEINSRGFCITESEKYISKESDYYNQKNQGALKDYQVLQYNFMFDKNSKSDYFFPIK